MTDIAYDKIATRARELLDTRPRPTTQDVADRILAEIASEFDVRRPLDFIDRLRPAMMTVVGSARAKIIRELEEEASRAYFARTVPSAGMLANEHSAPLVAAPVPALGTGDGQTPRDTQGACAVPVPESGAPGAPEAQFSVGAPTPASGGLTDLDAQRRRAALPESERTDGDRSGLETQRSVVAPSAPEPAARQDSEPIKPAPLAPVSPLSLRHEVLDGWRPLRDELLYVPEYPGVTYGSATAAQRQRAMTYYHSVGMGWVQKARRMRALDEAVKQAGVATLDELLDGGNGGAAVPRAPSSLPGAPGTHAALAGREP